MPESLVDLEAQRAAILKQMAALGDMRKGSLTETFRPCGKPACGCHAEDHPGHGPYYAFTTKVDGKTRTVQLRPGSRLKKFEREVETYRRFRALSDQLVAVNASLCELRPDDDANSDRAALKKTSSRSSRRKSTRKQTGC